MAAVVPVGRAAVGKAVVGLVGWAEVGVAIGWVIESAVAVMSCSMTTSAPEECFVV